MKVTRLFQKLYCKAHLNINRIIVGIGFIIATVLILISPLQLPDPDDWAYYHAVRNFSEGHFTVDNFTQFQQAQETMEHENVLLQYLFIERNKWALEKAPGVVFYLIPFYKMGITRWGNVLLALGMTIVTFILLKRLRDEKTAMIGSLLMLYTPISLVMFNRVYMDTYASLAFLVIGGGFYLYYHLEKDRLTPLKGGILLFLAFFFTGWSVVTRYTNLPIAVILALHLVVTRFIAWRKGQETGIKTEVLPLVLGIGVPVAALLLYDNYVFGSPWKYSYTFSPYPINFAFQYIGQSYNGESIPLLIFQYNLQAAARNWLIGFPFLIIGIPGFFVVLYYKFFKRNNPEGKWSRLNSELPWNIFLIFIGWFVAVFCLYLTYEWTAGLDRGGGFVVFNRFLLPGLFPVVIIGALIIARFPWKILIPVMVVLVACGVLLYTQWAWDLHILPDWLTVRTLVSRWPGYVFPPWSEAGTFFYSGY
jgi:hypothetical protein